MMASVLPLMQRTSEGQKVEAKAIVQTLPVESVRVRNEIEANTTHVLPVERASTNDSMFHDISGVTPKMRRNPRIWPTAANNSASSEMADAQPQELMTDFIPLNYESAIAPPERGRVVRVELPRSALAAFGLPVSIDRANERVKADVVLGEDGLAHAIRFVR